MKKTIVVIFAVLASIVCSAQSIKVKSDVYVEVPFSYLGFWFYEEPEDADAPAKKHPVTNVSVTIKAGDVVDRVSSGERNITSSSVSFPSSKLIFRFECEGFEPFETTWEQTELCQCLEVYLKRLKRES